MSLCNLNPAWIMSSCCRRTINDLKNALLSGWSSAAIACCLAIYALPKSSWTCPLNGWVARRRPGVAGGRSKQAVAQDEEETHVHTGTFCFVLPTRCWCWMAKAQPTGRPPFCRQTQLDAHAAATPALPAMEPRFSTNSGQVATVSQQLGSGLTALLSAERARRTYSGNASIANHAGPHGNQRYVASHSRAIFKDKHVARPRSRGWRPHQLGQVSVRCLTVFHTVEVYKVKVLEPALLTADRTENQRC